MNREIKKFNVWDSVGKQWWIKDATLWNLFTEIQKDVLFREIDWSSLKERLIFLLSTGLHDKNGKEIYEGDILLYPNDEKITVIWMDNPAAFSPMEDTKNVEIIGTIYENPELLQ